MYVRALLLFLVQTCMRFDTDDAESFWSGALVQEDGEGHAAADGGQRPPGGCSQPQQPIQAGRGGEAAVPGGRCGVAAQQTRIHII